MTETVFLSLGSNQGDRKFNLDHAIELLGTKLGHQPAAISDYIETKSWGFEAPDFLNAAVAFEIEDPDGFEILRICKEIERQMGREETPLFDDRGRRIYHSRPIDIDILLIGESIIDTEVLKVPHPLMEKRDFVMIPLAQVQRKLEIKLTNKE